MVVGFRLVLWSCVVAPPLLWEAHSTLPVFQMGKPRSWQGVWLSEQCPAAEERGIAFGPQAPWKLLDVCCVILRSLQSFFCAHKHISFFCVCVWYVLEK